MLIQDQAHCKHLATTIKLFELLLKLRRWVSTQASTSNGRSYAVERSSTARPLPDETFDISFPHASVTGIVVEDTVALASQSVLLKDFALGVVNQQSQGIIDPAFDGFIGLGFRGSSPHSNDPTSTPHLSL